MATSAARRSVPAPPQRKRVSPDERLAVRVPAGALTLAGFRAWATSPAFPEHVRATFLNGELYLDMSNEDPETHAEVKGEVYAVLRLVVRGERLGKIYPDGVLVSNEAAEVSNNPDAFFCSRESLRAGRVRVIPREGQEGRYREIEGTPDWVLEVVSDSSVNKDTKKLREAYHAAGIPEYWLVDARGEEITFAILTWRKAHYVAEKAKGGWRRSKVFGRAFRLTRRRDEFGLWEYTLEMRP